jgi:hypothetical protein
MRTLEIHNIGRLRVSIQLVADFPDASLDVRRGFAIIIEPYDRTSVRDQSFSSFARRIAGHEARVLTVPGPCLQLLCQLQCTLYDMSKHLPSCAINPLLVRCTGPQ